jgi:protein gp37
MFGWGQASKISGALENASRRCCRSRLPCVEDELTKTDWKRLHWIIVGGESGPNARPMHPVWVRKIRDVCAKHGAQFFFKQVGSNAWVPDRKAAEFLAVGGRLAANRGDDSDQGILRGSKKSGGRKLDGKLHEAMPNILPSHFGQKAA